MSPEEAKLVQPQASGSLHNATFHCEHFLAGEFYNIKMEAYASSGWWGECQYIVAQNLPHAKYLTVVTLWQITVTQPSELTTATGRLDTSKLINQWKKLYKTKPAFLKQRHRSQAAAA